MAANGSSTGSALGSGTVAVNSGGVLASDPTVGGTISGNVTANVGGDPRPRRPQPGRASLSGALNIGGSVSLANSATLNFDLSGSTVDPLNITGLLAVNGMANVTFNALGRRLPPHPIPWPRSIPAAALTSSEFSGYDPQRFRPGGQRHQPDARCHSPSGPAIWQQGVLSTSWTDSTNWVGSVPSGTSVAAIVGSATATPTTITLDTPTTLGQLTLTATNSATRLYAGGGLRGFARDEQFQQPRR